MAAPFGRKRAIFEAYDLSGRAEETQTGYVVALAQTLRGEIGKPYYFAKYDTSAFIETLGDTTDLFTGPAECLNAIDNGCNLIVIPVAHFTDISDVTTCTKLAASCLIPDRGGTPTAASVSSKAGPFQFTLPVAGFTIGTELGPFIFTLDTNDKFQVRVGTGGVWGGAQAVTLAAAASTTAQVTCDQINAQTTGINAVVLDGKVKITATNPGDDVEILVVANDCYSTIGIQEAVFNHSAGTTGLSVSINGAADQNFVFTPLLGETSTFVLTSAQIATQMSALTGGTVSGLQGKVTITSGTTGVASTVQIAAASTALALLGFDDAKHEGTAGEVRNAWEYEFVGPGEYGNDAKIYFYDSPLNPGERMNFRRTVPGGKEVYFKELSRDPDDPLFWKNYINVHDPLGRIVDVVAPNAAPYDWPALNSAGISFSGGSDGTTVLEDSDWIGHPTSRLGLYAIDKVKIPIIHFFCFGTTSNVVHAEALQWADSRVSKFYHAACPTDMLPDEIIDWRMGNPPDFSHAAFNSPSMSLVSGFPEIYDSRNNGRVSISGLSFLAAAITRTEEVYGPGIAPFGIKRGQCPAVLDIDYNVDEDSAAWDLLSVYGINSVTVLRTADRNWGNEGAYLWGGYTTQRNPSKMQDWAVVWLIKAYQLRMLPLMQRYISDPNKPAIWGELRREMEPLFRGDLQRDKIAGYFMNCDDGAYFAGGELKGATINTADSIDRGEYVFRILIKPYSQIGWPIGQMGIMRTGDPWATYAYQLTLPNYVRI